MTLTPYHQTPRVTLYHGDCLDVLRQMPDNSVHAVITDPPYGLAEHPRRNVEAALLAWLTGDREHVPNGRGFMGREWDAFVPPPAVWDECFRVLRPGGHLLAFCGSRTFDLMAMSIRLAGLTEQAAPEIRDSIAWLYGSGFPKSLDVSKAIDKAAGAQREVTGRTVTPFKVDLAASRGTTLQGSVNGDFSRQTTDDGYRYTEHTAPATDAARQWSGWGTALKPAFEPIVVARKPLTGTVAANVQAWGTGALNIDACRVHAADAQAGRTRHGGGIPGNGSSYELADVRPESPAGRWPANVVLDGDQADAIDQQSGTLKSGANPTRRSADKFRDAYGDFKGQVECTPARGADEGGASRFFPTFRYQAKAPTAERPAYVDDHGNTIAHPTVKPVDLFAWLARLTVPPGGTFIDPFAGSGASGEAATREHMNAVLIERDESSARLITRRLDPIRPRKQAPPPAPGQPHQPDLFDELGA